jgi:hypothetical protein
MSGTSGGDGGHVVPEASPAAPDNAALRPVPITEVTLADVQPQLDFYLGGGIAAARQVLPAMTERGTGTILFAHIPLSVWIGSGGPETQPDTIAEHYWTVHTGHDGAEHPYDALP